MITKATWERMKENDRGYFALTAEEKECLGVAHENNRMQFASELNLDEVVWSKWHSSFYKPHAIYRVQPDAPFPEEVAARESVPDGWTFVGHGRETQATDTDYIARFVGVWVTNEQWSGCCSAAIYAVRNDAPDEIWQRFGIEKNPHRKEPEFEVLEVCVGVHGTYSVWDTGDCLTSAIVGLHSVRYEDADGKDYGWMWNMPPVHDGDKLLIPKQVRIQRQVQ